MVDLDCHRPIALLPGRDTATVRAWLSERDSIRIVARDRVGAYADTVNLALPGAVQVADRCHLVKNLRDALERLLLKMTPRLREAAHEDAPTTLSLGTCPTPTA